MQICIQAFNRTIEKSHLWLKQLTEIGNFSSEEAAYSALRAVLHCLRDRLIINESAHLAAQLPMLIRGMFYEGWRPESVPQKIRSQEDFIANVDNTLMNTKNKFDVKAAIQAVFKLLDNTISEGEIRKIKSELPRDILELWP